MQLRLSHNVIKVRDLETMLDFYEGVLGFQSNNLDHMAFRVASLADVREMIERLGKDGRASDIGTVTHGNAWSVYFRDPEGNRIEVFCDSPWHVQQPEIVPWDPAMSDEELIEHTRNHFSGKPEFGPMEAWTAAQKRKFGEGA
jgi:catechol-2,3-dioxygenase